MRILADSFPESRMPFPRKPRLLPSRLDKKRRPIVARTVAFVVLVCGVLFAMQAWDRWRAYEIRLNDTRIATSNIARTLARHAQDSFKMADTILVGLVERLEVDGTDAASLSRLHTLLKTHVHELPMLHGLFLYGADGSWYTNSQATLMRNVNNADREYFVFHRDHPDRGPHIGVPVRSRSTGDWIIPLSRRFNHADGSFAGVVLATVKMEHFKQMYESIDVGRDGVIFLALDNGTLLFRRPFNEAEIGRSIIGGPVFNEYRSKGPVGTAMLTSSIDKVERLYSHNHVDIYPLLVATALSKREILANWEMITYRIMFGVTLLVAGIGILGLRVIRQINVREQIEVELREAKSALEDHNQALETIALQDSLTGLGNRRLFDAALHSEFNRARRNGYSLALVVLDVDYFKQYNDIYGHPAGDDCLRQIGHAIKTALHRAGDLAVRHGGEEFGVLLPVTDMAGAMAIAEKIRLAAAGLKIVHSANPVGIVTISAGVAGYVPVANENMPMDLVSAADQALYVAKSNGRNRVCNTTEPVSA